MSNEMGIPTAINHLECVLERLDAVRLDLGQFISESDEARDTSKIPTTILGNLTKVIVQLEDETSSIRYKVDQLMEDEPK